MIGYAFCGSFCTVSRSLSALGKIAETHEILPIYSAAFQSTDTRFGSADAFISKIEEVCGRKGIRTIAEAEPLGPGVKLDALIISPCTGNTLAKLACGITDTPVTMAAKAHLRNRKPLVIALATNDALSANLKNIGALLDRKNVFFTPMTQDDPVNKPASLVCDFEKLPETLASALEGRQIEPVIY